MPKIDRLWAFIVETEPNDEAVISGPAMIEGSNEVTRLPLMSPDMSRIDWIRPTAQHFADQYGTPVKLALFSVRTDVETLMPHGEDRNGH